MTKNNRRQANAKHLSCRHDDGKNNRTKLLDGIKDTQLTTGRRNGSNDIVPKANRICQEEFPHHGQVTGKYQPCGRQSNRIDVHPQHHLVGIDIFLAVIRIDTGLPLRRERIRRNVHKQKDKPQDFGASGSLVRFLAQHRKDGDTNGNQKRFGVLRVRIIRPLEDFPHAHDGDNLTGLEYRLHGKRNIFERSVLRPRRDCIGQSAWRKREKGRRIVGEKGPMLCSDGNQRNNNRQETVRKDTKGRRGKLSVRHSVGRFKSRRHDQFLHIPPRQVRRLETTECKEQLDS
mmetsp:Transcript_17841/g.35922  ORF Transcript_17841/g.35922 Transcript_17841/m.35922 type:complete len:288 (-) Transcript_17841:494-1357(-)